MNTLRKDFQRFLESGGYCTPPGRTACALSKAKTLAEWRIAESDGLVRIVAERDREPFEMGDCDKAYVNQYGRHVSAKEATEEIQRMIEREGVWIVSTEWFNGDEWVDADCVAGCLYDGDVRDPFVNDYAIQLMRSALDAREAYVNDMAAAI